MKALREEMGEVVRHERPELGRRAERPIGGAGLLLDAADEGAQAVLPGDGRLLHIEEHRLTLSELELVLDARDRRSRRDPAVALPVNADEDVALADVGGIEVARRVRTRALFEQDRRETQRGDRLARLHAFEGQLAKRR
jgi:hypothetical protein